MRRYHRLAVDGVDDRAEAHHDGDGADETPDVDALVAELRARVEERRRAGAYPPGLEEELSEHFRRILKQRRDPRPELDLRGPLMAAKRTLPLQAGRISLESDVPIGQVLHRSIARLVGRQTQGVLEQVQAFAQPVIDTLEAVVAVLEGLAEEVGVEIAHHLDAIYERQAAYERAIALAGAAGIAPAPRDVVVSRPPFIPWYPRERFDEELGGTRDAMVERYRPLAERLADCAPVLVIGRRRGGLLELLGEFGIESRGIDVDSEVVKTSRERGLSAELADARSELERLERGSLGALVLIQVVEPLDAQELVDLVALAAEKVRSGGRVFVETVNPQSLYVFAHSFYLDPPNLRPVHPAYLAFLLREAGFVSVEIEWQSPPPEDDALREVRSSDILPEEYNRNVERLNRLLFAPQDYLISAVR